MRYKGLFKKDKEKRNKAEQKRKEENTIDTLLLDTDVKLRMLYDRYKIILNKEIARARADKTKGIRNQDNYAKIGIAYYSMIMIKRAQERMNEMTSARALFHCMNEMNNALQAINSLNGRLGKINAKKTISDMKKMSDSSGGASIDLKKTLEGLGTLEETLPGADIRNTGTDALVSVELIERLISSDVADIDQRIRARDGISIAPDEILREFDPAGEEEVRLEKEEELDIEKLRDLLDSM